MTRRRMSILVVLAAIVAAGYLANTAVPAQAMQVIVNTVASNQHATDNCPAPFNTPGYSCTFQPATVTTTSHTKIVVKKTVEEQIKQFETVNHVVATINEGPPMSGAGCIDPTTVGSWDFHAGNTFKNTDKYHRYFLDTWQQGWEICGWHMVKIDGQYWIVGTKANCHNRNIMIPVRHKLAKPTKQVLVFSSVKTFESTYERWATSTTSTVYTCTPPFTLTYVNGQAVCFIATQVPVTPTTPTTTSTTTTTTVTTTTTPAPPPTFTMSFDTINDIPAGTCRPETLHVNTSVAGQIQISPNAGRISTVDCYQTNANQLSQVTVSVGTGQTNVIVYVYESNDPNLSSDTLTAVPLIAGVDAKAKTASTPPFTVSHPVRP